MKELLNCFDYIKRYHSDMLDSIAIMLEIVWLKRYSSKFVEKLIVQASKRKPIYDECALALAQGLGDLYIPPNPSSNLPKILKVVMSSDTSNRCLEEFLHIITQKKTTHKLFSYSTPLEINELLVGLLDMKEGESVYNPCYGMGSLFFAITGYTKQVNLYGEELEASLARIAHIICKIVGLNSSNLILNDILKSASFQNKSFDKIICNPPLDSHIGTQFLKEDARFATYETLIKTYPELLFLIHSLSHLREKGVFILRTQTLQKSSIEGRLRERLCEEGLIEAIIELPKNIFPHQTHDFSIIVLSQGNKGILHINANHPHFFQKDGKYNRLIHLDELLHLYHRREEGTYSCLTPMSAIDVYDLRVVRYVKKPQSLLVDSKPLRDLGVEVFRGQRVYGGSKDEKISYFDLGIADFSDFGFLEELSIQRFRGEVSKIEKFCLKPYDIALSIRGTTPKFTILSPKLASSKVVANAGIVVLRAAQKEVAIGLYCYLFSQRGGKALTKIYEHNLGSINPLELERLPIPNDFLLHSQEVFEKIEEFACAKREIELGVQKLKESL